MPGGISIAIIIFSIMIIIVVIIVIVINIIIIILLTHGNHPTITKPVIPLDHDVVVMKPLKMMTMTLMMIEPFSKQQQEMAMSNGKATMCDWCNNGYQHENQPS